MASTLRVRYVVPEDGDVMEHPNTFRLRLPSDVAMTTLAILRQQFPVPGNAHLPLNLLLLFYYFYTACTVCCILYSIWCTYFMPEYKHATPITPI